MENPVFGEETEQDEKGGHSGIGQQFRIMITFFLFRLGHFFPFRQRGHLTILTLKVGFLHGQENSFTFNSCLFPRGISMISSILTRFSGEEKNPMQKEDL